MKPSWWPEGIPYPQPSILSPHYSSQGIQGRARFLTDQTAIARAKKLSKVVDAVVARMPAQAPMPTAPSGSAPQYVPAFVPPMAAGGSWAAGAFGPSPSGEGVVADASVGGAGDGASAISPFQIMVGLGLLTMILKRR